MEILFFCSFQATKSSVRATARGTHHAPTLKLLTPWESSQAEEQRCPPCCPEQVHGSGGTSKTATTGRLDGVVQTQEVNSTAHLNHLKHFTNELYKNKSKWHGIKPHAGKRLNENKKQKTNLVSSPKPCIHYRIDLLLQHFSATRFNSCIRQNIHQSHT